ncbi:serine/threonine-protein kinase [Streptomyces sp. NPDC058595]|uniref:serine/threonine-protein kinase n=1 Tax=Streptomyces sp. NPDC058595 TaxID=3346550 RepID=UPI00364CCC03
MGLLPGEALSTTLEKGHLALPDALYIAACVADTLEAAHDAGLTHRDIKPSNIMFLPDGGAKVVDFGITKGSDDRHDITTTGVLIGTPACMAPEALSGTIDHRSDLYSLGWVLYEMTTGQRPFTGTSWHLINQHLNEQPTPLRTLRPDAPEELERFVSRLGSWPGTRPSAQRRRGLGRPRRDQRPSETMAVERVGRADSGGVGAEFGDGSEESPFSCPGLHTSQCWVPGPGMEGIIRAQAIDALTRRSVFRRASCAGPRRNSGCWSERRRAVPPRSPRGRGDAERAGRVAVLARPVVAPD